jgi:hypothetical protein
MGSCLERFAVVAVVLVGAPDDPAGDDSRQARREDAPSLTEPCSASQMPRFKWLTAVIFLKEGNY